MLYIHGNKGGSSASARVPVEAPNTLQSRSIARILDLIGEGEILGLVDGDKSIYLDGTPLQNENGTYNFTGVTTEQRVGTPSQSPIPGFTSVATETNVSTEITAASPLTRTVANPDADAVRIKIRLPALYQTNTSTGDVKGTTVELKFEVKASGDVWVDKGTFPISGKTMAAYERHFTIPLDTGSHPFEFRVTRITADSGSSSLQNQTYLSSYTNLIYAKLTYPDCALIGIEIDAEQFGSQIPSRAYEVYGRILSVPSNYTPATRSYSGMWDGTFQLAWSDNPAWVVYDLMTNARYGLGRLLDASIIDKWVLYEIAQYCDELIDDGFGGQEPRFTFNGVLQTQEEAYNVINAVVSSFFGVNFMGEGTIFTSMDRPGNASQIVGPANVIDGEFNYTSSQLKARPTVVNVTWNDPEDDYRAAIEVVSDPDLIAQYGERERDVVAVGCTSRGQAHRYGKWIIDTEHNSAQVVDYTAAFDHIAVRPGDIVNVADPNFAGIRMAGRLLGVTSTTSLEIVQDPAGLSLTGLVLFVQMPDGSIESQAVASVVGTTVTLSSALSALPNVHAMFAFSNDVVEPRPFRVIRVVEQDKNEYHVTAALHDPNKYARIEQDIHLADDAYTLFVPGVPNPPDGFTFQEQLINTGVGTVIGLVVSFTPVLNANVDRYEIQVKSPDDDEFGASIVTAFASIDIPDAIPGVWEVRGRSIARLTNVKSQWSATYSSINQNVFNVPLDVTGFRIELRGGMAHLYWDQVAKATTATYKIKFSSDTSADWASATELVTVGADQTSVTVPARTGVYLIKAISKTDKESANATSISTDIADIIDYNVVSSVDEHTAFAGAKTDVEVASGVLQLIDDSNVVRASGTYEFDNVVDLQAKFAAQVKADIQASGESVSNTMASWAALSDVMTLSGADASNWRVTVEVATSDDNATYSAWQPLTATTYLGRYFKGRAILESFDTDVRARVSALTLIVDMPDRVVSGEDIASSDSAATSLSFGGAFFSAPAIGIAAQDMQSGDYYVITNKTVSGFDIRFYNSSDTGISRTFDWLAKGHGKVAA